MVYPLVSKAGIRPGRQFRTLVLGLRCAPALIQNPAAQQLNKNKGQLFAFYDFNAAHRARSRSEC